MSQNATYSSHFETISKGSLVDYTLTRKRDGFHFTVFMFHVMTNRFQVNLLGLNRRWELMQPLKSLYLPFFP